MPKPTLAPPPETIDPWNPLCCAGTNGLVTVVIMLLWWGEALKSTSTWQDDSCLPWSHLVADVTNVMAVVKGVSGGVKKRARGPDRVSSKKKWVVINRG